MLLPGKITHYPAHLGVVRRAYKYKFTSLAGILRRYAVYLSDIRTCAVNIVKMRVDHCRPGKHLLGLARDTVRTDKNRRLAPARIARGSGCGYIRLRYHLNTPGCKPRKVCVVMYQLSESKELIARLFFLYGTSDAFGRTSDAEAKSRASGNADESALREVLFKFIIHFYNSFFFSGAFASQLAYTRENIF